MNDLNKSDLVWHTEPKKVSDLIPNEKNPRKISKIQKDKLKQSFERFNLVEIPAIDLDNRVIAGHQRLMILKLLGRGDEIIDVRVPNRKLTQEEYDQYLIASNAVTGDWDFDKLKDFGLDMLVNIGFDQELLNEAWKSELEVKEEKFDIEQELKSIKTPETKLGDIIEMGPHKLICGDSTDLETLKKLFGSDRASMIYSDPIYNIDYNYKDGLGGKSNYGGQVVDTRSDKDYEDLLRKSMQCALAVSKPDTHIFYWSDQTYIGTIQSLYRELNIQNKRVCLWLKNGQNPTPGVAFNKCYEPCTYGTRGKPYITPDINDLNEVMNKETTTGNKLLAEALDHLDIWAVKRLSGKDYEHATSKPPELNEKAIRRCTRPGDIILDSFSGSASTMIAAEQLKRRVYAVELEPLYCDLAIKRYEALTGIKAKIISDEKTAC